MTTVPSNRRRERGSGTAATWNEQRQRFEIRVTLANGKRTTVRGRTQREAEKAAGKLLGAVETGEPTPNTLLKTGPYLTQWAESVRVASLHGKPKRGTWRSYDGHVRNHLEPELRDVPLTMLSPLRLQKFFDARLAAGHSPAIMDRVRATLRIALGAAERQGLVTRNAAKLVKISVPDNSRTGKALEPEQVTALLEAARGERNGPMLAFLCATGLRLGEAQALCWSDIDDKRHQLTVRHTLERMPNEPWTLSSPKSRPSKDRVIPLVPLALEVLRQQQDRQEFERKRAQDAWQDHGFVFANEIGDVTAQRGIQDAYKRSLARAGLDTSLRVHDLRHTAVTFLIALGIDLPTVQAIVGHSTLAMTSRYAHVQKAMMDNARQKMTAFYGTLTAEAGS